MNNLGVPSGIGSAPDSNAYRAIETIISPHGGWFDLRLRQLWRYRELLLLFVWRDFVAVYKQTVLGLFWHILRPLLTTLVFTVVFGQVARLPTNGAPPFLFYMAGTVCWSYFATSVDGVSRTFTSNAALLGKVYFHRLVIPLALIISGLTSFLIQLGLLAVSIWFFHRSGDVALPGLALLGLPLVIAMLAGYSLGLGLIVTALTTRYRDLVYAVTLGLQLLMYLTPVIYPLAAVPKQYESFVRANTLSPVLEAFRLITIGAGTVTPTDLAYSGGVMLLVLLGGLILFNRVERTFMDTV
jgi:lipopolysaccharide transport system permease protein